MSSLDKRNIQRPYLLSEDYKIMAEDLAKEKNEWEILDAMENWNEQFKVHYPRFYHHLLNAINNIDDYVIESELIDLTKKRYVSLSYFENQPNPSLRYAKLHLMIYIKNEDEFHLGIVDEFQEWEPMYRQDHSFNSPLSVREKENAYTFLMAKHLIEVDLKETFINIFSNKPQTEISSKIKWLAGNGNKYCNESLFMLLHCMSPKEYRDIESKKSYFFKILSNFDLSIGKTPKWTSLKSSYYKWLKAHQKKINRSILDPISRGIYDNIGVAAYPNYSS